jgi:hypothetical protein
MDEKQAGAAAGALYERSLKEAMRQIRVQEAERSGVVVAIRDAEMSRLEMLKDKLDPVFRQIPPGIDIFDTGLTPGDPPRLWIDMVSFVEIGRDKRTYRFLQDTRLGRTVILESDSPDTLADAVTAYVAQRLVERERMLARQVPPPPAPLPRALVPPQVSAPVMPQAAAPQPSYQDPAGTLEAAKAAARLAAGAADAQAYSQQPAPTYAPQPAPAPAAMLVTPPPVAQAVYVPQGAPQPAPAPQQAAQPPAPQLVHQQVLAPPARFGMMGTAIAFIVGIGIGAVAVVAIALVAAR